MNFLFFCSPFSRFLRLEAENLSCGKHKKQHYYTLSSFPRAMSQMQASLRLAKLSAERK